MYKHPTVTPAARRSVIPRHRSVVYVDKFWRYPALHLSRTDPRVLISAENRNCLERPDTSRRLTPDDRLATLRRVSLASALHYTRGELNTDQRCLATRHGEYLRSAPFNCEHVDVARKGARKSS